METIYDILLIVLNNRQRIKPNPLLRYSNRSPQRFAVYYEELLEKELLKEELDEKDKKFIVLTNRGFQYIKEYKTVLRFINEFEL